ncbi:MULTISPECIES: hypothetical protein [unclassified Saccharothrix]|uniref:hypothetical protein n=1 Tax=unclassified Saccharothrix TaxID=2593673 RepID=UPI00307DE149
MASAWFQVSNSAPISCSLGTAAGCAAVEAGAAAGLSFPAAVPHAVSARTWTS